MIRQFRKRIADVRTLAVFGKVVVTSEQGQLLIKS